MSGIVRQNLKQRMCAQIFVVIDIRLNHHVLLISDLLRVLFVKGELYIGLAELDLLPAGG